MTTEERAERVLALTVNLIRANMRGRMRPAAAVGESTLLMLLSEKEGGSMTAGEICNVTGQGSGRTANLLKATEAKGYIVRTRDPSDGRRVVARITPSGREEGKRRRAFLLKKVERTFELLGEEDAENAFRILEKLAAAAAEREGAAARKNGDMDGEKGRENGNRRKECSNYTKSSDR